jgi:hypothetical protein
VPTNFRRSDLLAAFLTGVEGLNRPANVTASEVLRLNTAVAPVPEGSQNVSACSAATTSGFPAAGDPRTT